MPNAAAISGRTVIIHVLTVALASAALCGAGAQDVPARPPLVGAEWVHTVVAGESWTTIGAREGITPAVLAARNERTLKSQLRTGDIIVIDNRHIVPDVVFASGSSGTGLVVNIPQRLLFLFADGRLQARYPIAAGGHDWQTPVGAFAIVLKEENPTWDVPASIQDEMRRAGKRVLTRVPPGPSNPLGKYWLGLSLDSVGIHGTNAPLSIYSLRHARVHQAGKRRHRSPVRSGVGGRSRADRLRTGARRLRRNRCVPRGAPRSVPKGAGSSPTCPRAPRRRGPYRKERSDGDRRDSSPCRRHRGPGHGYGTYRPLNSAFFLQHSAFSTQHLLERAENMTPPVGRLRNRWSRLGANGFLWIAACLAAADLLDLDAIYHWRANL